MFDERFYHFILDVSNNYNCEENLLLFLKSDRLPRCSLCLVKSFRADKFHIGCLFSFHEGTPLYAAHFRPGQYVDVTAKT